MSYDLNSPEQIAANKAKREQARVKKAKQRVRYAEQEAIDTILATSGENYPAAQQAIWQRAKSKLSDAELHALQTRQDEFLGLARQVKDVIDGLPKGRKIGPPDGLPFIDTLYDTCLSGGFVLASDGTSLVFHLMGEEFADLHRDISAIVYKHFSENIDSEWFKFGFYTRFLTMETWNKFVDTIAEYIQTHPDDENLEKETTEKIITEWQKRQPRRPVGVDFNSSESYHSASEVIRASQVAKEIDAQKSLLDPFNQSNYQF